VLGTFLEGLAAEEWERPSLCPAWRVHDVVAHCIQSHVATPWRLTGEVLRSGFSLTRRNERWVRQRAARSRAELLDEYRTTADHLGVPAAELPYALVETVVHGYDIAWPLDREIEVPADVLAVVAETCRTTGVFLGGKQRCAGLAFRASDVAWSAGAGPEVSGPAAAIVMAGAGRAAALDRLRGPGLEILRSRL
jgi:uncharacterized protein (TIGR03083 family)